MSKEKFLFRQRRRWCVLGAVVSFATVVLQSARVSVPTRDARRAPPQVGGEVKRNTQGQRLVVMKFSRLAASRRGQLDSRLGGSASCRAGVVVALVTLGACAASPLPTAGGGRDQGAGAPSVPAATDAASAAAPGGAATPLGAAGTGTTAGSPGVASTGLVPGERNRGLLEAPAPWNIGPERSGAATNGRGLATPPAAAMPTTPGERTRGLGIEAPAPWNIAPDRSSQRRF